MEQVIIREVVRLTPAVNGDMTLKSCPEPIVGLVTKGVWNIVNTLQSLDIDCHNHEDMLTMSRLFQNMADLEVRDSIRVISDSWLTLVSLVESGEITHNVHEFDIIVPTMEDTMKVRACFLIGLDVRWELVSPPKYSVVVHVSHKLQPNAADSKSLSIKTEDKDGFSFETGV